MRATPSRAAGSYRTSVRPMLGLEKRSLYERVFASEGESQPRLTLSKNRSTKSTQFPHTFYTLTTSAVCQVLSRNLHTTSIKPPHPHSCGFVNRLHETFTKSARILHIHTSDGLSRVAGKPPQKAHSFRYAISIIPPFAVAVKCRVPIHRKHTTPALYCGGVIVS